MLFWIVNATNLIYYILFTSTFWLQNTMLSSTMCYLLGKIKFINLLYIMNLVKICHKCIAMTEIGKFCL